MDIFTYGITTSRYSSSLVWQQDKLITSIGSNLSIWDLNTLNREKVLQYNTNVVMSLIENSKYIFSIGYNAEIYVLDKHSLQVITHTKSPGRCVRHASVTEDHLAVSSESGPNKCKGVTVVFSLKDLEKERKLEPVFRLEGRYRYCTMLKGGKLFIVKENVINEKERQEWRELKKDDPNLSKDSKPKKKCNNFFMLYDIELKNEIYSHLFEHVSDITSSMSNNIDLVNILYMDRRFLVINPLTFELIINTKISGAGAISCTALIDRSIYLSPKPGVLTKIDLDAIKNFPENFEADQAISDAVTIYKLPGSDISSKIFCFLLQNPKTGVICHEDGITVINITTKEVRKVSCFNITCCGTALSNKGDLIACGDFSGNAMIFPTQPTLSVEPLSRTMIMESVRTLIFDSTDESVLIGTLTGKLLRWWIQDFNEPRPVATFDHSVLHIRYNYHSDGHRFLVVGLSSGMFAILKEVEFEHNMNFVLGYYGHMPSTEARNPHFGSLHKYAEIWSTVWSATSNNLLVTASEDQTCCVWDIENKNPVLTHKLTGHTKAVTSIDWRVMDPALGELFISCSDDQTARVYDPQNGFKLLFTFSTSFINEWHTLTYLALEKDGTRVAIGAQNGFLFIYDLVNKEFLFAERIHNGSVEGLDWKGDTVITCSADNSVSLIRMPKKQYPKN